jgi:predicted ATPase/signal transduction histidine kinase
MLFQSKYIILGKIDGDESDSFFRARMCSDNTGVILKFRKGTHPESNIAGLKHEYDINRELRGSGIPRYLLVEEFHSGSFGVIENVEGQLFDHFLRTNDLDLESILKIAIGIAVILEQLHQQSIVHQGICPANFIIDPDTLEINLLDFSHAFYSNVDPGEMVSRIESCHLAYISPEQTGRLNERVDIRSDLYSLGIVLYEMATGSVPFEKEEALSVIHAHIARNPTPPHEIVPYVPLTVSRIILKLLAKDPRQRYQSPSGIKLDLIECLQQWVDRGTIELFELGRQDFSGALQDGKKFYGREKEIAVLRQSFQGAKSGGAEIILIDGPSGIGKSALVGQLRNIIKSQGAGFIEGKFEQFQRNIPYFGFIQAFKSFTDVILTQSHERITFWKQLILKAVGDNGKVLTDVIPHLELLIGQQPELPELELTERENRLHYVFGNFIKGLAQKDHPLVIFLDDVQWVDAGSASLIKYILSDRDFGHYLFIGASRTTDEPGRQAFNTAMNDLKKENIYCRHIPLLPLSTDNIVQLVLEMLGENTTCDEDLIRSVEERSQGNPFFIKVLLNCLYAEEVIQFDRRSKKWKLDESKRHVLKLNEDIVDLMIGRLRKLPAATQDILKLAACLGYHFDVQLLTLLTNESKTGILETIRPAISEGLVFGNGELFRFSHDRIEQAAYAMIPRTEKKGIHLNIGNTLLQKMDISGVNEYLFEITNQLNEGRDLITSLPEKNKLAALNLEAGIKAKNSAAYKTSLDYFDIGIELLATDSWVSGYALALPLYTEGGEAAFLSGEYQKMHEWIDMVLRYAANPLDKIRAYETRIKYFIAVQKLLEAVEASLGILALLGVTFPTAPSKVHVLAALAKIKLACINKPTEALTRLPLISNRSAEAAIRILSGVGSAVYFSKPDLFPLFVCKAFSLMLRYGNSNYSGVVTASYAIILLGGLGDIEGGYRYAQVAKRLCNLFEITSYRYQCTLIINNFILHWKEPLRNILEPLKKNYWSCLETGNTEFACLSAELYCFNAFFCGKDLKDLAEEMLEFHAAIVYHKQGTCLSLHKIHTQMVLNLTDAGKDPLVLTGKVHDEPVMLQLYEEAKAENLLFDTYLCKTILSYLFERYEEADSNARLAFKRLDSVLATPETVIYLFYDTLTSCALLRTDPAAAKQQRLRTVRRNIRKLRKYDHFAPENCSQKLSLLQAELCCITGVHRQAAEYFDKAISEAAKNGYINDLALSYELAGRFYWSQGREFLAAQYITLAYNNYLDWGANAKAGYMRSQYPFAFPVPVGSIPGGTPVWTQPDASLLSDQDTMGKLDLRSIMKAVVAISAEIEFDKLIKNLIRIAVENAGAQQGYLILVQGDALHLKAHASVNGDILDVSLPLETTMGGVISTAVVKYVHRTKEDLLIDDVGRHPLFSMDPVVTEKNARSILCMPIILQGEIIALLYFEHDLISKAFSPERVEVLKLLSGQMAISLQNALNEQKKIAEQLERERLMARINNHEQELLKTKLEIQEQTLNNISAEIHDNIGQTLSFIKLSINNIGRQFPDSAKEDLAESVNALTKVIQDLRDLSKTLNTDFIGNVGLVKAIDQQLQFLKRTELYHTQLIIKGEEEKYDAQRELVIFRVVQELLNNVVKHADASEITVTIEYCVDELAITVRDNGKGFHLPGQLSGGSGGLGLSNIQNRISLIRGKADFESTPGLGTTMKIAIKRNQN